MPRSLTDLAGLNVNAADFLAAVLETAAQPIWVVDPDGVIRFANPAAIAALGYDSADELFGRHSHETIHYQHPDGTPYPAASARCCCRGLPARQSRAIWTGSFGATARCFPSPTSRCRSRCRRAAAPSWRSPTSRTGSRRGALREHDGRSQRSEASLRRIATLVAGGAASAEVFAAIAREVAECSASAGRGVALRVRRHGDRGRRLERASASVRGRHPLAARRPGDHHAVRDTGRPARSRRLRRRPRHGRRHAREAEIRSGAGAPIVVDGEVWGVMAAGRKRRLPDRIEDRLAEFTELVATAISNSASRDELARLADEQAALRRVATLVARGVPPPDVFAAVAHEVGLLLGVDATHMARYELDGTATGVAAWSLAGDHNRSAHESAPRARASSGSCRGPGAPRGWTATKMRPALRQHWAGSWVSARRWAPRSSLTSAAGV